jgi:large subunit ribosomal protein L4
MGNNRTNVRRGGGVAFAKVARDFSKGMPKKQRRLATLSAMLEKMLSGKVILVTDLKVDAPKTKEFAAILANLKIDRSCLVMIRAIDEDLYRSARNIPKVKVQPLPELNAGDVCNYMNVVFAKDAFEALLNGSINSEN